MGIEHQRGAADSAIPLSTVIQQDVVQQEAISELDRVAIFNAGLKTEFKRICQLHNGWNYLSTTEKNASLSNRATNDADIYPMMEKAKAATKIHRDRGFFGILGVIKDAVWFYPTSYHNLVKLEKQCTPNESIPAAVDSRASASCFSFFKKLNPFTCCFSNNNVR